MKKNFTVFAVLVLAAAILLGPSSNFVDGGTLPTVSCGEDLSVMPGGTVDVYLSIENNPGIISLRNSVAYDMSVLELTEVTSLDLLKGFTNPAPTVSSPYVLRWADSLATENNTANGRFARITFTVSKTAPSGYYRVSVTPLEARTSEGAKISFAGSSVWIIVLPFVAGDADGDGELTDWDSIVLERYLASWPVDINLDAMDLDGDGECTDWDSIVLNRYLAGWDVEINDPVVPTPSPVPTEEPTPEPTPAQYHKYFTMSFDDGITQDARIIEILKKYNMPCTFNINTGLYGVRWDWVAEAAGKPGLLHQRFTLAEIQSGIYDGFDVEVHTLNHPSLAGNYGTNKSAIIREVGNDASNIAALTGVTPVGMAYPGGLESDTSDFVIRTILENTPVRFARLAVNQSKPRDFALPEYWMMWYPTCSICNVSYAKTLFRAFMKAKATDRDLLFYGWGHGYELDQYECWDAFEELIKMISEADDVICVTNAEFYELFKDQIPSWKD